MEGEQMSDQSEPAQKLYDVLIEALKHSNLCAPPKLEACFETRRLMGDLHNLIPDKETEALVYALMMDIRWCIEGTGFALGRFRTLHWAGFENSLQWVAPRTVSAAHIPALSIELNYSSRAMVVAYTLFEVYAWIIAVWDRLGLLINLIVLDKKEAGQKQPSWNRVFNEDLVKGNCGRLVTIRASEEFKKLHAASDRVFRRASAIRNVLAHRLSVIALKSREFSAKHGGLFGDVAKKYLLPTEQEISSSGLEQEPQHTTDLCKGTLDAVDALIDFLRAFLATAKDSP